MTIEAVVDPRRETVGGHVQKVGHANKIMKRKGKGKTNNKKRPVVEVRVHRAIQELYESCKQVFKGPGTVPLPDDVHKLCHLLDKMRPEDFGLSSALKFFQPKPVQATPRVSTATIYKCDEFALCIFFLPETAVIPLHNHPGMTVFSKLLLGTMQIKSYDWVNSPNAEEQVKPSNVKLAKMVVDDVFTAPCDTSVLYPTTGGNIHQFTALTPCAFLDILGPPYSNEDGRDCSFYKEYPYVAFSGGEKKEMEEKEEKKEKEGSKGYAWLEEIEMPENSIMNGIEYQGPPVVETN